MVVSFRRRLQKFILIFLISTVILETLLKIHKNWFIKQAEKPKYILIWSLIDPIFHSDEDSGLDLFLDNNCEHYNCIITSNREVLGDLRHFDAIVFSAYAFKLSTLPWQRSPKQKYIMASLESPAYFYGFGAKNPVYFFNGYFNWTWTYRLNSDILWRYFLIYDLDDRVVGPRLDMKWLDYFKPVGEDVKKILRSKSKTAAWIVSNCVTLGKREYYVGKLRRALERFNLTIDRYGKCSNKTCGDDASCARMVKQDYHFYLAFENSFDEDYVTEKVLKAVQGFAVPIVLGGANYTRFLPPGSYLDARKLPPEKMARTMLEILKNFTTFQEYFRWTNHYRYKQAHRSETCNLCNALYDEDKANKISVYPDMRKWWTGTQTDIDYIYNKATLGPLLAELSVKF